MINLKVVKHKTSYKTYLKYLNEYINKKDLKIINREEFSNFFKNNNESKKGSEAYDVCVSLEILFEIEKGVAILNPNVSEANLKEHINNLFLRYFNENNFNNKELNTIIMNLYDDGITNEGKEIAKLLDMKNFIQLTDYIFSVEKIKKNNQEHNIILSFKNLLNKKEILFEKLKRENIIKKEELIDIYKSSSIKNIEQLTKMDLLEYKNNEIKLKKINEKEFIESDNIYRKMFLYLNGIYKYEEDIIYFFKNKKNIKNLKNKIFVGAPGTGKSYKINQLVDNNPNYISEKIVFHPEYDYNDFVGTIKPNIDNDESNKLYEFYPGPFTRLLKQAIQNKNQQYYLIIEEMTRGNCSAIFGNIFQLLDRGYRINDEYISKYVYQGTENDINDPIYLPDNFHILGTINSSDQNVYPLDTAFKRRFDFEYIDVEENKENISDFSICGIKWKDLYMQINNFIINELELEEDKQVGPFFIKEDDNINKLFIYLWEDVNRYCDHEKLFNENIKSLSQLLKKVNDKNVDIKEIFNQKMFNKEESDTSNDKNN